MAKYYFAVVLFLFFFFKQKTAYEIKECDWSSDVCSSDLIEAQREMRKNLKDVKLVLMLSTMLHSIAVGNLLPSYVKTICVDINPATVTKLMDRGSAQALGVVTDVGVFLPMLNNEFQDK